MVTSEQSAIGTKQLKIVPRVKQRTNKLITQNSIIDDFRVMLIECKEILTSIRHSNITLRTETHVRALHVATDARSANVGAGALVDVLAALLVGCELPTVAARAHERAECIRARAMLAERRVLRALVYVGQGYYVGWLEGDIEDCIENQ